MELFDARNMQPYQADLNTMLRRLAADRVVARLWNHDPSLWHPSPDTQARIQERLGWLDLPADDGSAIQRWAAALRSAYADVLYVASGAPADLARLWRDLAPATDARRFVLAETPAEIDAALANRNRRHTAIVVAIGDTAAPEQAALLKRVATILAEGPPATDQLTIIARPDADWGAVGDAARGAQPLIVAPNVGDRCGAFSALGLAPAALLGWDVARLIEQARAMQRACMNDDLAANPGVRLGAALGVLAQHSRDKLAFSASSACAPLARWLAGVVAGSLSKHGRGFVPIVAGDGCAPESYARHRIVVCLYGGGDDAAAPRDPHYHDPTLTFALPTPVSVAAMIFVWYVAIATTAMIIGVNPFDEPDTVALHGYMRRLLTTPERMIVSGRALNSPDVIDLLRRFRERSAESYAALPLYLPPSDQLDRCIGALRHALLAESGLPSIVVDPARDHAWATQSLHAGRQDGSILALIDGAALAPLERARLAADVAAWNTLRRRFVVVDLGNDHAAGLTALRRLLREMRC